MDVSKIILTSEEQTAFDSFRRSDSARLTREQFQLLSKKRLIQDSMDGSSGWFDGLPDSGLCRLSELGKDLRAYQAQQVRAVRRDFRRYWITTGIAVAALIKSFMPEISAAWAWLSKLLGQ